jgi:hypothetical protein
MEEGFAIDLAAGSNHLRPGFQKSGGDKCAQPTIRTGN